MKLARDLARRIEEVGATALLAEKDVKPAGRWADQIRISLRHSDEVVVLFTNYSIASELTSIEIGAAFGLHKPIVPIVVSLTPDRLPDLVKSLRYLGYKSVNQYLIGLKKRVRDKKRKEKDRAAKKTRR
jgi:hypothetical protein